MAYFVETLGEDVLEEATHELGSGEGHSPPSVLPGVFVPERNSAVFEGEDSVIGDGDTVDVAGKIL
jgi:hypothetical protein